MASFSISVRSTADKVSNQVRRIRIKQLPFAVAKSLTLAAKVVSQESGAAIGDHFKVRNKGLKRLLTFQRAEKKDWPKTRAIVHLREKSLFMADHVDGATRKAKDGSSRQAVPTSLVKRTARGKITKGKKPRAIRNRKRAAVEEVNGTTVIRVRKGKRARLKAGIFYTLHREIKIKEAWPVEDDAADSFAGAYPPIFQRELDQAVRRAK